MILWLKVEVFLYLIYTNFIYANFIAQTTIQLQINIQIKLNSIE